MDNDDVVRVVELAQEAVEAAFEYSGGGDARRAVGAIVEQIARAYGAQGLSVAVQAWCDTHLDYARGGDTRAMVSVHVNFVDRNTGNVYAGDAHEVPEGSRWAGKVFTARATSQREQFFDLIGELFALDDEQVGDYLAAMIAMVVHSMHVLPRGYAAITAAVER